MDKEKVNFNLHRETLVDKIAEYLEKQILSGSIPKKTKLSESKVATKFNVSRVPAREALNRLEDMGLIEKDHRGRRVKALELEEFREIFQLKNVVEAYCVMQGAFNASEKDYQKLNLLLDEMSKNLSLKNKKSLRKLNIQFHNHMVNCSQNKRFIEVYESQKKKIRFTSSHALDTSDRPKVAFKEHREILKVFVEKDGKKVRTLIEDHKNKHMEFVIKKLTQKNIFE
jgi:DNA-binding GntR family transcriptional regulator